uniref:Uncharacterized protein n=1 Tax=Anopheles dirus TaxID=7168 RepID=A0A182NWM6_9DIPT
MRQPLLFHAGCRPETCRIEFTSGV